MTLEFPLAYTSYITPHFQPHRPHLCILALETKSESLLESFESWEDFFQVSKKFHLIKTCEVWKLFKVKNIKLLTPFQNTKASFYQTSNFFFHRTSWNQLFHHGLWKLIFDRNSWNTSLNRMGIVSSWSRIKILSYEVKFIFSVFGQIFIAHAWVWLFNPYLTSLWV